MQARNPGPTLYLAALLTALATLATACSKHQKSNAATSASALASTGSPVASARRHIGEWHVPPPSGPMLAILAGKGVGPIRVGASVATIERQMHKKCDVLTDKVCRYVDRAVQFDLAGGKVETIRVERPRRPAGKDQSGHERYYGIFNGAIPPDVRAGMQPWAVQRVLGAPQKVEQRDGSGSNHVVEIAYYEGMVLAYDRMPNGKLALGEIRIPR